MEHTVVGSIFLVFYYTNSYFRHFIYPELNVKAVTYDEIINWNEVLVTFPPILHGITNQELDSQVFISFLVSIY